MTSLFTDWRFWAAAAIIAVLASWSFLIRYRTHKHRQELARADRAGREKRRVMYSDALNLPGPAVVGYDIHGCAEDNDSITEVPDDSPDCKFFGLYGITPDGPLEHISDHPTRASAEKEIARLKNTAHHRVKSPFIIAAQPRSKPGDVSRFREERKS